MVEVTNRLIEDWLLVNAFGFDNSQLKIKVNDQNKKNISKYIELNWDLINKMKLMKPVCITVPMLYNIMVVTVCFSSQHIVRYGYRKKIENLTYMKLHP